MKAMGYAAEKMKQNDGSQSNEILFWQAFEKRADRHGKTLNHSFCSITAPIMLILVMIMCQTLL